MGCCGGGGEFKPDNKVKNSNVKTETKEQSGSLISIMMVILVLIAVALIANRFFI